MSTPVFNWPVVFLRLAILLLALGILPAVAQALLFPDSGRILTAMLLITVAPLGAMMLLVAIILFLAAVFRRR